MIVSNTRKAAMSADIFGATLTITFSDGRDFAIDVTKLDPSIQKQAMLHGLKQKLVDAAAIARNTATGKSASIEDKYKAVKAVHDRLVGANPSWNKGREAAAATGGTTNNLLVRALMKMTGKDKDYVEAFLENKTKEQRAALKKNPRVLQIIAELQAAAGTGDVDTDALLGELGAVGTGEGHEEEEEEEEEEHAREPGEDDGHIEEPTPAPVARPRARRKTTA